MRPIQFCPMIFRPALTILFAIAILLSGQSPIVHAQPNILFVKADATGANNGSSWTDAYAQLQDALIAAGEDSQIWVAAGTYRPGNAGNNAATFLLTPYTKLYGGFAGTDEDQLSDRDWTANIVVLNGDLNGNGWDALDSNNVVTGATGAVLDGVTVTGANDGSGILNNNCSLILNNLVISKNRFSGVRNTNGGNITLTNIIFDSNGIGLSNFESRSTLINVYFNNNSTNMGGGISNVYSDSILKNVTFTGNNASKLGGAIFNVEANMTMDGVSFEHNTVDSMYGGAIFNDRGNLVIDNSTFTDNHAEIDGGAIYSSNSHFVLTNSSVNNNSSQMYSGGIDLVNSTVELKNVSVQGNTARYTTGGISIKNSNAILTNVTIYENSAGWDAGGIKILASTLTINHATVSKNSASECGGICIGAESHGTIKNSIVWDNTNGGIVDESSMVSVTNSIAQSGYAGDGNIDADPIFAPFADYGGGLPTLALLPGSPAINSGGSQCADVDQRGVQRPVGSACDIGAFESKGFSLAAISGSGQAAQVQEAFAQPLVVAVTANGPGEPVDGGWVSFSAPESGSSAHLSSSSSQIILGKACVGATANSIGGVYKVTSFVSSTDSRVDFGLTNLKVPIQMQLKGLAHVYSGQPKAVSVTTELPDLKVIITYDGSSNPPTAAGHYKVLAKVEDVFYQGSVRGIMVIAQARTSSDLRVDSGFLTFWQPFKLRVIVSPAAPGAGVPSGTVTFFDGKIAIGTATLIPGENGGMAILEVPGLPIGDHHLNASYGGDRNFIGSTSDPIEVIHSSLFMPNLHR